MERIQAAIAKARDAREGRAPEDSAPAIAAATAPVSNVRQDTAAARAAWKALPQITPPRALLAKNRIVASEGGREALAFDLIRTRILQQMRDKGWKRLAVTSPSAACGKSTVCLNLALSLTRQREVSVALVEMDMRRPSIAKTLGISERHSVASILRGDSQASENGVRFGDNLALFTMDGQVHNPSDLLHGASVEKALADIQETYAPTVMIFDMPPLLVNDDTLAFLRNVDSALIIAAAGTTTISEIDTCERELAAHTEVMGVVLNKCRYTGRDYGADYY